MRAETWPDSSTAFTTRTAYESPPQNFCTPATMAAAADLCPPPVSDEMIKIFGTFRDISCVGASGSLGRRDDHRGRRQLARRRRGRPALRARPRGLAQPCGVLV